MDNLQKKLSERTIWKKVRKGNLQKKLSETMIYKICQQNYPQRQFTKSNPIQVLEDLTKNSKK